jgi:hypothetical protein
MIIIEKTIVDLASLEELLPGPLSPKNPVKWAAYAELQKCNGKPIHIVVGTEEDLLGYVEPAQPPEPPEDVRCQ